MAPVMDSAPESDAFDLYVSEVLGFHRPSGDSERAHEARLEHFEMIHNKE
jgi:hypothetical protein